MKTINQTLIILGIFLWSAFSHSVTANAACPAAPVGNANDAVVQMKAHGGNAGMGATNVLDATEEGAIVYDDANDTVKVCDGLNWVELGSGGGSGMTYQDYTDPTHGGNPLKGDDATAIEFCRDNGHSFSLGFYMEFVPAQTLAYYQPSSTSWNTVSTTQLMKEVRCTGGAGGLDASNIDDLGDVDTSGKSTNDVLSWDGTNWAAQAPSGGGMTYTDYTDPTHGGNPLYYNYETANEFCRDNGHSFALSHYGLRVSSQTQAYYSMPASSWSTFSNVDRMKEIRCVD